ILGIVWTSMALIIGAAIYCVGVNVLKMDVVRFLVTIPIPFIFGTIILLNMLQGSLFAKRKQPAKGLLSAVAAALIGTGLAGLYSALAAVVTGRLHSGPPTYDFE